MENEVLKTCYENNIVILGAAGNEGANNAIFPGCRIEHAYARAVLGTESFEKEMENNIASIYILKDNHGRQVGTGIHPGIDWITDNALPVESIDCRHTGSFDNCILDLCHGYTAIASNRCKTPEHPCILAERKSCLRTYPDILLDGI